MTTTKNKKQEKIENLKRLARPKTGRQTYPHSVSLTLEQIEFLSKVPNASALIRSILDDLIKNQQDIETKIPILSLKQQIDQLEQQKQKYWKEHEDYAAKHDKEMYKDGLVDQPLDTPEAKYHRKILDSLADAYLALNLQIRKLKEQVVSVDTTDV